MNNHNFIIPPYDLLRFGLCNRVTRWAEKRFLRDSGTMVHLIEPPDGPGNDLVSFHVAFEVENFDETVEILKNSKYEITNGPQIRHDGQRAIYIQDMDGNTIEFATHNNIKHSNRVVDAWGYTKNAWCIE